MRFLKKPKRRQDQPIISWVQERFDRVYRDPPASEIPNNTLADSINMLLYGDWAQVRPGSRLWSSANLPSLAEDYNFSTGGEPLTPLPNLPGRADYEATKSGYLITKTAGRDFSNSDLYNFFVWPDGYREIIMEVIDSNIIRVKDDDEHAAATSDDPARIVGRINQRIWHDDSRLVFIHIDTRVFYTDWRFTVFTEVMNRSSVSPADEKSTMDEYNGFVYLYTSNGIFQIDPKEDTVQMYRMNSNVIDNDCISTGLPKSGLNAVARRYLTTLTLLSGEGIRNRGTSGVRVMKETGANTLREEDGEYKDYRDIYYPTEPRETDGDRVGYLESFNQVTSRIDEWKDLTDGAIHVGLTVNGVTETGYVYFDFSEVNTWEDIAEEIQDKIRFAFSQHGATVVCRYNDQRFYLFAGPNGGDAPSIQAGWVITGTNIAVAGYLDFTASPLYTSSAHIIGYGGYTTSGKGLNSDGLKPPTDEKQFTHLSVYGTKTTLVAHDKILTASLAGGQGVNIDQFAWLQDVPLAKAFTASIVDSVVTATQGTFERMDVGSILKFQNGDEYEIRVYNSSTSVDVRYAGATGDDIESQSCCIGDGRVLTLSQDGTTVKRTGGTVFTANDVGKLIFWADGGYGLIREYEDEDEVRVWESQDRVSQGATMDPVSRCFNDTVIDEPVNEQISAVESRFAVPELIVPGRYYTPLPNCNLGTFDEGVMFTANKDGNTVYYSEAPDNLEYRVGHHYVRYQKRPVKDSIQSLQEYPGKIGVHCSNSTWKILTNSFIANKTDETGEVVWTITGLAIVDPDIGIKDQSSIHPLEGGAKCMLTNKSEIRIFDGYKYSDNLAVDEEGKGYFQDDLNLLQSRVAVGYNELYGYMIWGSAEDKTDGRVLELTRCYKVGFRKEHSLGWGELSGDGWVIPEPGVGALKVYNDKDQPFYIVIDAVSGLPYMLAIRQGPEGSGIDMVWRDKIGLNYDAGYEIPWEGMLKEHRGQREDQLIRHLGSGVSFRPQDEANQGTSGYTEYGYRTAQEITITAYENGEITETVRTDNIPYKADIAFDKQLENNRIQLKISGTASEIKMVNCFTDYEDKDQRGAPPQRFMSEHEWQEELGSPTFWVCREVTTNLADGSSPTGSIFGFSSGPDGEDSSMVFASGSSLLYSHSDSYSGNFTIMFGISGITSTVEVLRIGSAIVSITVSGSTYTLSFNDGTNTYTQELDWNGSGWVYIKISRYADTLILSENGAQLTSIMLTSIETLSGNIDFQEDNVKNLFDPRVYEARISEDAFNYYYRNVTVDNGEAVLCPV